MVLFVICGRKEDEHFCHVVYVANHLERMLPDFAYEARAIEINDWQGWLSELNSSLKWNHLKSPVIWKHIPYGRGRDVYIGGITEFWEYVYDYYNISSFLTGDDLVKLVKDYAQYDRYH